MKQERAGAGRVELEEGLVDDDNSDDEEEEEEEEQEEVEDEDDAEEEEEEEEESGKDDDGTEDHDATGRTAMSEMARREAGVAAETGRDHVLIWGGDAERPYARTCDDVEAVREGTKSASGEVSCLRIEEEGFTRAADCCSGMPTGHGSNGDVGGRHAITDGTLEMPGTCNGAAGALESHVTGWASSVDDGV
jgi:hypothetical protein